MVRIITEEINIAEAINGASDPAAGAIDVFIGTTRNNANGKRVLKLEYEAYNEMALEMMQRLLDEASLRWSICKCSIIHRVGRVDIGEASVVIAVSSPHRNEAFEACKFLIDRLKQEVPIWKKEFFEDGEIWVDSRK
ncbi:MAG: molybdenum cofactor biosynthesis protein MoaE [Bacteroidetes bacterium]|nr:MAG: molybdenum cofactor biosynthesis protein MoaE [Bacteroidota bacterium]